MAWFDNDKAKSNIETKNGIGLTVALLKQHKPVSVSSFREKDEAEKVEYTLPWWSNPFRYILFFLLPFFLVTVLTAGPFMLELRQAVNNLSVANIGFGLLTILMLAAGCAPFAMRSAKRDKEVIYSANNINRVLLFTGGISLITNLIFFSSIFSNPAAIMAFLTGKIGAASGMRDNLSYIPGITSFMSASLPFFALYGWASSGKSAADISKFNRRLLPILFFFIATRAILGSERLALVEAVIAYAFPKFTFQWKPGMLRTFLPYIGVVGVFVLFGFGEYFRSWKYYMHDYDNYLVFASVRFFGYFATAINTGAGIIEHYPPIGYPSITVGGLYKLFCVIGVSCSSPAAQIIEDYLNRYATPEFNNPGGLYMPYLDYGILGGALYILLFGVITGWLYVKFLKGNPIGILLYPSWFVALLDIIRLWTWGGARFIPVIFIAIVAAFLLGSPKRPHKPPLIPSLTVNDKGHTP